MKTKRSRIPDDVKLKLWVFSGGRCEFPGCNRPVWRDGLTLQDDNFAHMAHLVAASPDGPRGDRILSSKLAADFSNLMLVCLNHSKLIDGKHKSKYTLDFLRSYKAKHERRIQIQTAIGPDMGTTVLQFIANIRERRMSISPSQAYDAIFPRFPSDERGILMDFTNKQGTGNKSYWREFAKEISADLQRALAPGNDRRRVEHLSVFAIAPMPLLIHLGNRIGGSTPVEIYQKHRNTDDWKWKKEPKRNNFRYFVRARNVNKRSRKVAVILSLSGKIHPAEVDTVLPNAPNYEITIKKPSRDFLQHRSQLSEFARVYRELLARIRGLHGGNCEISLFPAVPVSVAVTCGHELLPKADPRVTVYDRDSEHKGFVPTLTIN